MGEAFGYVDRIGFPTALLIFRECPRRRLVMMIRAEKHHVSGVMLGSLGERDDVVVLVEG